MECRPRRMPIRPFSLSFPVPAETPVNTAINGYRWHEKTSFILLTIEASAELFPSELDYNAGGVLSERKEQQTEDKWLFSAIDLIFDDFVARFGSTRKKYAIYGHSAGGGFVHRFVLLKPHAKFSRAVAANPAFVTMPDRDIDYPFGLRGAPIDDAAILRWTQAPLTLMLGALDLGPRTKPLSNGPDARRQGLNVFTRGRGLYKAITQYAQSRGAPCRWTLDIVEDVGHSNALIAPHAVKYLFPG